MKFEFSRQIFEKYSNFMEIHRVGAELFRAERGTDRQKKRQSDIETDGLT